MADIQLIALGAAVIGFLLVHWSMVLLAYLAFQCTELSGVLLARRIFYAARDPKDPLDGFVSAAIWNELIWSAAVTFGIGLCLVAMPPDWRAGALAVWCLAAICVAFQSFHHAKALIGGIAIQVFGIMAALVVAHCFAGGPLQYLLANLALVLLTGGCALFIGRRLAGIYDAQLDRERALIASVAANRAMIGQRTELLGRLSHEMRTPMNGIMGLTSLLQRTPLTDDQRRNLELLRTSGEHMVSLLDDSLDLAQLESKEVELSIAPVDLAGLAEEQIRLYRPMARERGLSLSLNFDTDVPDLMALDAMRVRQCVSNLITNAMKYSEQGQVDVNVAVDVGVQPAQVVFNISDRGVGVSPELAEAIFDPYAKARTGALRTVQGAGLGLAITRRFARLMGGDVTYVPREGGGSTFRLHFRSRVEVMSWQSHNIPAKAAG